MQPIYEALNAESPCFLVHGALDLAECRALVEAATRAGFQATDVTYPPSYRDNDRRVSDDPALARHLFARLRGLLPETLVDAEGTAWDVEGLNERFRYCRYRGGQSFRVHKDGAHAPSEDRRSRLTLQIYLDGADQFEGGRTRFYASRFGAEVFAVTPERGAAVVFDHDLWHDGEPVTGGTKHVLRTDVMYTRRARSDAHASRATRATRVTRARGALEGHTGYVFRVLPLPGGEVATASRDRTIRIWKTRGEEGHAVAVLRGHTASVHALAQRADGALLSGSRDGTIRAWDRASGASRILFEGPSVVLCLERVGNAVAAGLGDATIRVLPGSASKEGDEAFALRGHAGWVWALAAFGATLVSGSDDGTLRIWDTQSRACLGASSPGRGAVHSLLRVDDKTLAAGFADGHVVVYEADWQRALLHPISVYRAHRGEVYALAMLGDSLVTGGEDEYVRARPPHECEIHHKGFVRSLAITEDGVLASGGYDGALHLRAFS